jgi:uncharacterized repeat protein (TIGR01451 family)
MKKIPLLAGASLASIVVVIMVASPVFACTPVGSIVKEVQDQTTGSAAEDANSATTALSVNTGDTLIYTITIKNSGAVTSNGEDNMENVTLTDNLPSGIQLESNPTQTTITENLGTVAAGASVTKTYAVKVTDTTNGDIVTNTACYTGQSTNNDDNQKGCDSAVVKVTVPVPTPTPTPTPTTPVPTTMPDTGSTAFSTSLLVVTAASVGYALNVLRLKYRINR